jgi:transposase
LHRTWSRIGCQPRVDTYGQRKTAHIFGAVSLSDVRFSYRFATVFNGNTFLLFLKQLVAQYHGQKIFLIIDNGPCHTLNAGGQLWLHAHSEKIQLCRLPPYSPEFNPMEPIWKTTRKLTTHNQFYNTTDERDSALRKTFKTFKRRPRLIVAHVERWN